MYKIVNYTCVMYKPQGSYLVYQDYTGCSLLWPLGTGFIRMVNLMALWMAFTSERYSENWRVLAILNGLPSGSLWQFDRLLLKNYHLVGGFNPSEKY